MKKILSVLITAAMSFTLSSCLIQEPEIPLPKLTFSDTVDADFESITLSCTVSGNVTADRLTIEYSKDESLSSPQKKTFEKQEDGFTLEISGLEIETTYYYRYTVENKISTFTDEKIRQFKTLDYVVPGVTTVGVKDVSGTKATLEGKVDFTCGKTITAQGFKFGKDKNKLEDKPTDLNSFSLKVEGLEFETTYYYQAYATSEIGTGYGEVKEFNTCNAVSFKAVQVKSITATNAVVTGGVKDNGGIKIEQQGFRYGKSNSSDYTFVASTGDVTLNNLKAATTYKVWYYAKTFEGEFESDKVEFATSDGVIAFGETTASEVTAATLTLSSSISADGGSTITKRGFVYGTKTLPTTDGDKIAITGTTGQMSGKLTNLTNDKTYYIRPYAINAVGTSYGAQITVKMLSGMAELGQTTVSEIKAESAKFASEITSANGSTVTASGFCYGQAKNPTTADSKVTTQSTSGQITATASSLKPNTTYYVRAYATTKYGTSYGSEKSFTTKDGVISFQSLSITNVLAESAEAAATISADGGSSITETGFCYSTADKPTVADKTIKMSTTETNFSSTISSLSRSTKYYVRAYAINSIGTYYSEQKELSTGSGEATLGTLTSSNVESTTASFTCEVTSDGGASITQRGFCYSSNPTPTTNSLIKTVTGTVGAMESNLSGLEPNSSYYVRAFATTKFGTTYSNEVQITTTLGLPTMSAVTVSNIQPTSATLTSGIASAGDGYILEKGFCYSTSAAPDKDDTIVYVNADWTVSLTGLSQYTKYYVRSFATTQYGTSYSEEISFTTTYNPVEFGEVSITNVGITSLTVSGSVSTYGENEVIDEGFCYSTTSNPTTSDSAISVMGSSSFATITTLSKGTKYYIRRYVINSIDTFYSSEISATTYDAPINSIYGVFSVSESKKVVFSKGNIWQTGGVIYGQSEEEFIFAEHQYSVIGEDNVSHDGYSTHQTPTDMIWCSRGTSTSGVCKFVGDNWTTLTNTEWDYLLTQRVNASSLFYRDVTVCGVVGALILPDHWNGIISISQGEIFDSTTFSTIELAGGVFIPYAGRLNFSYQQGNVNGKFEYHGLGEDALLLTMADYGADLPSNYYSLVRIKNDEIYYFNTDSVSNANVWASLRMVSVIK